MVQSGLIAEDASDALYLNLEKDLYTYQGVQPFSIVYGHRL